MIARVAGCEREGTYYIDEEATVLLLMLNRANE